ncbi:MAG TPA: hypothetical protein EYP53_05375 [Candidatus Latescibacteria bacterium]|nr:hypothetical protein [Candidatus Latescibacterota bacterium]
MEWLDWFARFFRDSRLRLWSLHAPAGHELLSSPDEKVRHQALAAQQRGHQLVDHMAGLGEYRILRVRCYLRRPGSQRSSDRGEFQEVGG